MADKPIAGSTTPAPMEFKDFPAEYQIKTGADGRRVLTGYASTYGNVDEVGDRVDPGSLTKTLAERMSKIPYLWAHDTAQPIGALSKTWDDSTGLGFDATLSKIPKAEEVATLAEDGVLGGSSIGYSVVKATYEGTVRVLKEIKLYEVSAVTLPANPMAVFTAVKAAAAVKAVIGSYEALTEAVARAIVESGFIEDFCYVDATYPDRVIACSWDDGICRHYEVQYGIDPNGMVSIGMITEVQEVEIVLPKTLAGWARDIAIGRTDTAAMLAAFERKEGRTFSARNVEALSQIAESMTTGGQSLKDMLAAAGSPKPAKATSMDAALPDLWRLEYELASLRTRAKLATIGG